MANTRKNEISTINKIRFDPTNPCEDDIDIRDIAHALSMMTRANGHYGKFDTRSANIFPIYIALPL